MIRIKTSEDIEGLRASGVILSRILSALKVRAAAGTKLSELDALAGELLRAEGADAAFLGYRPEPSLPAYPARICASLNNIVVHGLPNGTVLRDGDILSLDMGVTYRGYVTDAAVTVGVDTVSEDNKRLMRATREALGNALRVCDTKHRLGDIGHEVEQTALRSQVKVIHNLVGHGVGFELHEAPDVYNFGERGTGLKLQEGMVLALEPMFAFVSERAVPRTDGSYATEHGDVSAHFETTVAITSHGPEVLVAID